MTKFSRVLKVTLQNQLVMLTHTLMIYLLVVAVAFIGSLFMASPGKYWSASLLGNIVAMIPIFMIVYIVRLILLSRNQMKSNNFRLIPITTNKLYLANILGIFLGLIYVQIVHSILIILSGILTYFTMPDAHITGFSWQQVFTPEVINAGISSLVLIILSPILIILLVHLIDFISTVILSYIPGGAQRLVKVLVYIIVIALVIYILSNLSRVGFSLINGNFLQRAHSVWLADGETVILIILVTLINVQLLHRMETIR